MIHQLRVKLANRPGTLQELLAVLATAGIDIKALEVSDRGPDFGEANLIVANAKQASAALTGADHEHEVSEALAVEMDDKVGGLASILAVLAGASINVTQLYAFVSRVAGKSLALISCDDVPQATRLLRAGGFRLFDEKTLADADRPREEADGLSDHLGLDFIW